MNAEITSYFVYKLVFFLSLSYGFSHPHQYANSINGAVRLLMMICKKSLGRLQNVKHKLKKTVHALILISNLAWHYLINCNLIDFKQL